MGLIPSAVPILSTLQAGRSHHEKPLKQDMHHGRATFTRLHHH